MRPPANGKNPRNRQESEGRTPSEREGKKCQNQKRDKEINEKNKRNDQEMCTEETKKMLNKMKQAKYYYMCVCK